MAERHIALKSSIDDSVNKVGAVITSSKDPYKLMKRSQLELSKENVGILMEQMREKFVHRVKRRLNEIIEQNGIAEKFEELKMLEEEGEKYNKENGVKRGYTPSDTFADVSCYLASSWKAIMEPLDKTTQQLEQELKEKEDKLFHRMTTFNELCNVTEQQCAALEDPAI